MPRAGSRSDAQETAGVEALKAFSETVGVALAPKSLQLEAGVSVALDGYGEDGGRVVVVEVSSQVGPAKAAQVKKVLTDVLKLATVKAQLEADGKRKVDAFIVFIDEAAARTLRGKSWHALAAKRLGVEPRVVVVSAATLAAVRAAKLAQNLMAVADAEDE